MVGKLLASDPLAVKLDTFWLTVEVKNVTDSFAAAPEFQPETGPLVKVPPVYEPPAVELKHFEVFKAEWVFVSDMFGSFSHVTKTSLSSFLTRGIHSVPKKRFYKNVSVVQNNSKFEINLGRLTNINTMAFMIQIIYL